MRTEKPVKLKVPNVKAKSKSIAGIPLSKWL
jgi:hypothetical protein